MRRWTYLCYISRTLGKDFTKQTLFWKTQRRNKEVIPEGPFTTQ